MIEFAVTPVSVAPPLFEALHDAEVPPASLAAVAELALEATPADPVMADPVTDPFVAAEPALPAAPAEEVPAAERSDALPLPPIAPFAT